ERAATPPLAGRSVHHDFPLVEIVYRAPSRTDGALIPTAARPRSLGGPRFPAGQLIVNQPGPPPGLSGMVHSHIPPGKICVPQPRTVRAQQNRVLPSELDRR